MVNRSRCVERTAKEFKVDPSFAAVIGVGQDPPQPPNPAPIAVAGMSGKSFAVLIHPCATKYKRRLSRYGLSTLILTLSHFTKGDSHSLTRFLPRLLCRVPHAYAHPPRPPNQTPTFASSTTSVNTRSDHSKPSTPSDIVRLHSEGLARKSASLSKSFHSIPLELAKYFVYLRALQSSMNAG